MGPNSTASISTSDRRSVRVLVADGDADTRGMYRTSLELAGCDVVDASDGRAALIEALTRRPALIVTETRLPYFDGYDLCRTLRRDVVTSAVPILVVTGETRPAEWDRAHDAGADAILIKPVDPAALLSEVRRLLDAAREETLPAGRARSARSRTREAAGVLTPASRPAVGAGGIETKTPPIPPIPLICPDCDRPLQYDRSYLGGVKNSREQWDYYVCSHCGTFEHRPRTRKLRRLE